MDTSNSEGLFQQNDSMAKEYCDLAEERRYQRESRTAQISRVP